MKPRLEPTIYVVGMTVKSANLWIQSQVNNWAQGQSFHVIASAAAVRGLSITKGHRIIYVGPIYERKDFEDLELALRFATEDDGFTARIEYVD